MDPRFVEMRDFLIGQLNRELTQEELAFVEWLSKWGVEVHEPAMKLFKDLSNNTKNKRC